MAYCEENTSQTTHTCSCIRIFLLVLSVVIEKPPLHNADETQLWLSRLTQFARGRGRLQGEAVGAEKDAGGSCSAVQERVSAGLAAWVRPMIGVCEDEQFEDAG